LLKKACQTHGSSYNAPRIRTFRLFIMNLMISVKRALSVLFIVTSLALCAIAIGANNNCPLPATEDSGAPAPADQSPEKEKCLRRVNHNGMPLCVPCPAAEAHMRHGDADLGTCTKPGNENPGGS
jgi:hypothetical protein